MCRRDPGPGGFAESYDCQKCKMNTPQLIRMSRGCGYEPRSSDRVHLTVWQPPTGKSGYSGAPLTVCPGFTCSLPEVTETALARAHWSKGNAAVLNPTEELLDCIVILDGQINQIQAWLSTPAEEGGGMQK